MQQANLVMFVIIGVVCGTVLLMGYYDNNGREKGDDLVAGFIVHAALAMFILVTIGVVYTLWQLGSDEDCNATNCTDVNEPQENSPGYHSVDSDGDGSGDYIRSNPDNSTTNNLNQ